MEYAVTARGGEVNTHRDRDLHCRNNTTQDASSWIKVTEVISECQTHHERASFHPSAVCRLSGLFLCVVKTVRSQAVGSPHSPGFGEQHCGQVDLQ